MKRIPLAAGINLNVNCASPLKIGAIRNGLARLSIPVNRTADSLRLRTSPHENPASLKTAVLMVAAGAGRRPKTIPIVLSAATTAAALDGALFIGAKIFGEKLIGATSAGEIRFARGAIAFRSTELGTPAASA